MREKFFFFLLYSFIFKNKILLNIYNLLTNMNLWLYEKNITIGLKNFIDNSMIRIEAQNIDN
jgi:hypothetical protein